MQFTVVLRAVVEAYNRRHSLRISHKAGKENHVDVHDDSVRGNARFAGIFQKLHVVEHAQNRNGNRACKFRNSVACRFSDCQKIDFCFSEVQDSVTLHEEIYNREKSSDALRNRGCNRRTRKAPVKYNYEQSVESDI